MPPHKKSQCGSCDEDIKRNENSVLCHTCKNKYPWSCSNLNENECKIMSTKSNLKWFCQMCENDVSDILNNFEKFRKVSNEIKNMKSDMEVKLKQFEERLVRCEVSSENMRTVSSAVVESEVERNGDSTKLEYELIESKKCNIVYYNVPESSKNESADRMKDDFDLIKKSYSETDIAHTDVTSIFRVGKKDDNKARPVVVKYINLETKKRILNGSENLKLLFNNESINIYVSVDRTPKQREEHKKLVTELKQRRDGGETDIVIRNDKIVRNFRKINGTTKIRWTDLFKN